MRTNIHVNKYNADFYRSEDDQAIRSAEIIMPMVLDIFAPPVLPRLLISAAGPGRFCGRRSSLEYMRLGGWMARGLKGNSYG